MYIPTLHIKVFKGQPRRFALSELVQAWYKTFPPDQNGQVEIDDSTMLRNKTSTAYSCAENEILQLKILGTIFYTFVLNDEEMNFWKYTPVRKHKTLIGSCGYICIYIPMYIHIYMYKCIYININTYIYTYIHMYIHTYIYIFISVNVNIFIYLHICN